MPIFIHRGMEVGSSKVTHIINAGMIQMVQKDHPKRTASTAAWYSGRII